MRSFFSFANRYLDELVNHSIKDDVVERGIHRAFIGMRLLTAAIAFTAFPYLLIYSSQTTLLESMLFCWFAMPLLSVAYLSTTGNYRSAVLISTVVSLPFLGMAALLTSGIVAASMMIWLIAPLIEAILSKHRHATLQVGGVILITALAIMVLDYKNIFTPYELSSEKTQILTAASILMALVYMIFTASTLEGVAQMGVRLKDQTEGRYKLLAANMTDAILRHNADGSVRFASSAIEHLTGLPPHRVMGKELSYHIMAEDQSSYFAALSHCLVKKEPVSAVFRLKTAPNFAQMPLDKRVSWLEETLNGETKQVQTIWVEMKAQTTNDQSSEIVSVWRDITARRMQEEKVELAQRETARLQETKTRFLANITHELRTPLNAILGFSQMLTMQEQLNLTPEKQTEYAGLIHDAGDHLLGIVNSILDMSKLSSGRFDLAIQEFSMGELVEQCEQIISLKAKEGQIKLHRIIQENLPEISADKRACRQILLNLLSNAVKFTPKGGSVTSQVRLVDNKFQIIVADTGIGIASSELNHLGEAFYQARGEYDRPFEGTGLGLSIVKGLVELHKGTIDIRSQLGKGTLVIVTLPIEQIEEQEPEIQENLQSIIAIAA